MLSINSVQKVGFFVGAFAIISLVVFHSPWNGYFEIGDSILDWTAKEPMVFWLRKVSNVVALIAGVSTLTAVFAYLFKSQ